MTRRVLVAVAAIVVVVALCSGCTGSGSKAHYLEQPDDVIGVAARAMAGSQTVEIATTVATSGTAPATQPMLYDLRNHVGEILFAGTAIPEVIVDGSNSYTSLASAKGSSVSSDWLENKLDPAAGGDRSLAYLLDPAIAGTADIASVLDQLGHFVQSVREAGSASVAGVSTTCYDLAIANQDLGSLFGTGSQTAIKSSNPVRLCVDDDNRLRMIQLSFKGSAGQITVTADYINYGVSVNITVPPKEDVITSQQLHEQLCTSMQSGSIGAVSNSSGRSCLSQNVSPTSG